MPTTSTQGTRNQKLKPKHGRAAAPPGTRVGAVQKSVSPPLANGAKRAATHDNTVAQPQNAADRWLTAILIFVIAGTPLAILPARFEMYDTTPKLVVLYVGAALLLWFPAQWWCGITGLRRTRPGYVFYALLMVGVASLVFSAAFSSDVWLSFAGTVWRRLGACSQTIAFFIAGVIAAYVSLHRQAAKTLMLVMEGAAGVASVYAILQYSGLDPLIPRRFYTLGSSLRPPATLTQATYFATFLLPAILIAAGFRLSETRSLWKRFHEFILLVSLVALFLSGTRSAFLGLGVAFCALFYFERGRLPNRRMLPRATCALLACVIAAILFLFTPAGKPARARIAQWRADPTGGPRLLVWRDSLPLIWRHPVAGIGPELFESEFRKAESLELARAYPDTYHESPHNFFLETVTAQGVVGLFFWVGLLILAGTRGIRASRARDPVAGILLASLLAMVVSLQFCPLTITNELYLLALAAISIGLVPKSVGPAATPSMIVSRSGVAFSVVLFCAAAAYAAQTGISTFVERQASRGDFAAAERWYAVWRKLPMPGPNLELSRQVASEMSRFASPVRRRALAMAQEAAAAAELSQAERFNALYQSAAIAIVSRDLPVAEAKLRDAIEASPNWYRPKMALASVLWWEGRMAEADSEAARALDCAGRVRGNVERTLASARAQAGRSRTGVAR